MSEAPLDSTPVIALEDEVEVLRIQEDLNYSRNRASLGKRSLALMTHYVNLYGHLLDIAIGQMPTNPILEHFLFVQQMLLECRADLIRTMLLLMRTHLTEAHAQTRRAIECCAWAKRIHENPYLVKEWLATDMETSPSPDQHDRHSRVVIGIVKSGDHAERSKCPARNLCGSDELQVWRHQSRDVCGYPWDPQNWTRRRQGPSRPHQWRTLQS